MASPDTKVVHEILIDTSKGEKNVKKAGESLKKFAKIGGLAAGAIFAAFTKVSIDEALDLEGTNAKFSAVFGEMQDDMNGFIKEFQKISPLTQAESRKMASGIQDLLIPMGFARDEATDMTKDMMHLGGALASFNDANPEEVLAALNSGLVGNTEALRSFGIQVDQEAIKQKAVAMGLAKSTKEVSKQAKAQALLALAYEQSGDALGAFSEENLNTREQLDLAIRDLKDISVEFGAMFIPLIREAASFLRNFLAPALADVIGLLTNLPSIVSKNSEAFSWLTTGIDGLKTIFDALWGTITTVMPKINALVLGIFADINEILNENADTITDLSVAFAEGIEAMGNIIALVFPLIKWYWDNYLSKVFEGAVIALGLFVKVWGGTFEKINQMFDIFSNDLGGSWINLFKGLHNYLLLVNQPIMNAMRDMINFAIIDPVNFAIARINDLIKVANKVPGVNLGEIGSMNRLEKTNFQTAQMRNEAAYNAGSFGRTSSNITIQPTPVQLVVDGEVLAETLAPALSRQVLRDGGNQ